MKDMLNFIYIGKHGKKKSESEESEERKITSVCTSVSAGVWCVCVYQGGENHMVRK